MKAFVMAGGEGKRLQPLTNDKPKPLVEVNGRPFLWYVVNNLKEAGVEEIFLVYRTNKEMFKQFISDYGFDLGLVYQDRPLGTGHAVKVLRESIGNEPFLVLAGDELFSPDDIRTVIDSESENCLNSYFVKDSSKYGSIKLNGNKFSEIIEKPEEGGEGYVTVSLYKFNPKIFKHLESIGFSDRGEYELPDAINLLGKEEQIEVRSIKDYWMDIGSIEKLKDTERRLSNL